MVGIASEGQNFDGNGLRAPAAGRWQPDTSSSAGADPYSGAFRSAAGHPPGVARDPAAAAARTSPATPRKAEPRREDRAVRRAGASATTARARGRRWRPVRRAISKNRKEFVAIIALALIAAFVGGYILTKQRLTLPAWVPGVGTEFTQYKAALSTAQAVTPGQGQTVQVAGVDVGELTKVDLVDGRAIVSMKVDPDRTFYRDASAMLRPKTGLNDMVMQVDPGTCGRRGARGLHDPGRQDAAQRELRRVPVGAGPRHARLTQLLLGGAGQAVGGQGRATVQHAQALRAPRRDVAQLTRQLGTRSRNIKRSVHNFRLLAEELGEKDDELAGSSTPPTPCSARSPTRTAPARDAAQLPSALRTTNAALAKVDRTAKELGPTLGDLRPCARDLGPALAQRGRSCATTTTGHREPAAAFARDAPARRQGPAPGRRRTSTQITPDLHAALNVAQPAVQRARLQPPGQEEGYLFWASWASHAGDRSSPPRTPTARSAAACSSCPARRATLEALQVNPQLGRRPLHTPADGRLPVVAGAP